MSHFIRGSWTTANLLGYVKRVTAGRAPREGAGGSFSQTYESLKSAALPSVQSVNIWRATPARDYCRDPPKSCTLFLLLLLLTRQIKRSFSSYRLPLLSRVFIRYVGSTVASRVSRRLKLNLSRARAWHPRRFQAGGHSCAVHFAQHPPRAPSSHSSIFLYRCSVYLSPHPRMNELFV